MVHQDDIQLFTQASIAHRCARETELFFQRKNYDPRYCFELFRRAIVERQQRSWELIYSQYRSQVVGWVDRHPAFWASGEEAQYFVNRAFEKMWAALTPEKFGDFADLKSILRYLQMCVHSAIVDSARAQKQETLPYDEQKAALERPAAKSTVEEHVLTRIKRQELWDYMNQRLKDEKERCIVYGAFVLNLKPGELYAQFQETFRDVQEVYRVKENLIARLRRDRELAKFLDDA
jgi:hypothetical protein